MEAHHAFAAAALVLFLSGCPSYTNVTLASDSDSDTVASVSLDEDDTEASDPSAATASARFSGTTASCAGSGLTASGGVVTITEAGSYLLAGSATEGRIVVDADDDAVVKLLLDGLDLSSSSSAPILVLGAGKTVITLVDGSENALADARTNSGTSSDPDAAIFCESDLSFNGGGSLVLDAGYDVGIRCKEELRIADIDLSLNSAGDGVKGKDFIDISSGSLAIVSGGDGLQAYRSDDADKGFVRMDGGCLSITSALDGIQAETEILITGGTISVTSGGGSGASLGSGSAKGIKAVSAIDISGGDFDISSADDCIHSDGSASVTGGTFLLAANPSSGQGIKFGDSSSMTISGDATSIDVASSYEGIAGYNLTVSGGEIRLLSSNDCFSMSAGTVEGGSESADGSSLTISGGYIACAVSSGDGVDSNGSVAMSGGTLIINGPVSSPEVAIDYNGSFAMSGGTLVAVACYSSGQTKALSSSSNQCSILDTLSSSQAAGTIVHITDSSGNSLVTFKPAKTYQSIIFSSPSLAKGSAFKLYLGGSMGTDSVETDGLYSSGTYTAAGTATSITTSSTGTVTTIGGSSSGTGSMPGR